MIILISLIIATTNKYKICRAMNYETLFTQIQETSPVLCNRKTNR